VGTPFNEYIGNKLSKEDLKSPSAQRFVALVTSGKLDDVDFIECLTNDDGGLEAIVIDIHVPLGQKKTINDIQLIEPVAVVFSIEASVPSVFPLRDDFPFHLPHVNIVPGGFPRSLCLSNQPMEDQLRGYTAAKYLCQIRWWFEETAYGKLHGEEQPLDPVFFGSAMKFIASDQVEEAEYLVGIRHSAHDVAPIIIAPLSSESYGNIIGSPGLMTPIYIKTDPVTHGQTNWLPLNFLDLIQTYNELGYDLLLKLGEKLKKLPTLEHHDALLKQPFALLIDTEVVANDGRSTVQRKVYVTGTPTGVVADKLGFLSNEGGQWAPLLIWNKPDEEMLSGIELDTADLHRHFNRDMAAASSGYSVVDERKIVLIGAGAVGSHVAMNLARGGVGIWHVVDDDFVLPHNQARIQLNPDTLASSKSDELVLDIRRLFQDNEAGKSHFTKFDPKTLTEKVTASFEIADAIIDASASVPVARSLACDMDVKAPVVSMFMNPSGTDAVLLSEASDRSVKIDCVEIYYYWLISCLPDLSGHLAEDGKPLPVGGCRSPSVSIPETRVAINSALMAGRWLQDTDLDTARLSIWRGSAEFGPISCHDSVVPNLLEIALGDWTVKISAEVVEQAEDFREKYAPKETGGIIAGSWDRQRKIIYVIGIYDAPPNSKHSETGFERGSVGVFKSIQDLENSTLGNLTYIGEWHSHPPGVRATPSVDDGKLLRWIGEILDAAEAPATMLIAGDDGIRIILNDNIDVQEYLIPNDK